MADLNHVVIIGGGIGGLCLAPGLKQAGVNATVYERDRAITDRLQGYRVHISPKGSRALHDCLPPALFDTFTATCGRPPRAFRMLTERMQTLTSVGGFHEPDGDAVEQHRSVSRITLRGIALAGMADRDAGYRELVRMTDPGTLSLLPIRTSRPVDPWQPSRVTLLGDAIHSMTPYRGIGANIALRDAALLCRHLVRAAHGEATLLEAIAEYEHTMRRYGFAAVRGSLEAMKAQLETGALARAASRTVLRMVNRIPTLKRSFFLAMAAE